VRPAHLALVAVGIAGGLSAGAQFMEHVLGLAPCPLCLMQRIWVMIGGLGALTALVDRPARLGYPIFAIAAALAGAGFAVRQLYLQSLPPDAVPACGPDLGYMFEAFPFSAVLKAMTFGTGDCAQVLKVLGVNIAVWSLLGFLALIAIGIIWARGASRPAAPP
jgi:protein dithiol:quinone oxidoreductase